MSGEFGDNIKQKEEAEQNHFRSAFCGYVTNIYIKYIKQEETLSWLLNGCICSKKVMQQ